VSKITRVKLPEKGEIHSYIVASDWHSGALDIPTYKILIQHLKRIPKEQRRLVIDGDFLDCPHLMGKKTDFKRMSSSTFELESEIVPASLDEFSWGNGILDELQKLVEKIYFIEGNHDWRYRNFMDNWAPFAYKHNFDLIGQLNLKERGIPFIKYNDWLDVGNLAITHGMFHGATHNKKHYEAAGKSVMYGHVHHANSKSFFHRGETKKAWSLPCMCGLNPEYIKNTDNNWTNGYASLQVKHNGNFNVGIHEIWDQQLILDTGVVLEA
jgi:UDP-2,3-diacylglucosamine pyrophosphatase LpxH